MSPVTVGQQCLDTSPLRGTQADPCPGEQATHHMPLVAQDRRPWTFTKDTGEHLPASVLLPSPPFKREPPSPTFQGKPTTLHIRFVSLKQDLDYGQSPRLKGKRPGRGCALRYTTRGSGSEELSCHRAGTIGDNSRAPSPMLVEVTRCPAPAESETSSSSLG